MTLNEKRVVWMFMGEEGAVCQGLHLPKEEQVGRWEGNDKTRGRRNKI
jgi:hypothetical protein